MSKTFFNKLLNRRSNPGASKLTRRVVLCISLLVAAAGIWAALAGFSRTQAPAAKMPARPKLVILITIDQFRNDYLDRFRPRFVAGGFNRLMSGARFTNCRYDYASTVTGPGHATLATGANPSTHGIIANAWYDRTLKRPVNCVEDMNTRIVDSAQGSSQQRGASPRRLLGSTFSDELRTASGSESKIISIALKDRGAILPGGHSANAAYWYQAATGAFVSSTYYMEQLPAWVAEFNGRVHANNYCGKPWKAIEETSGAEARIFDEYRPGPGEACPSSRFLAWMAGTPFLSEIQLSFAREAMRQEKLGQGPGTDILAFGLSANDSVGHRYGPHSPQLADMTLRTDRELAAFFEDVDRMVGLSKVWIALSADHGVAPTPQYIKARGLGHGSFESLTLRMAIENHLSSAYGEERWIDSLELPNVFLNLEAIAKRQLTHEKVAEEAARAAMTTPGVFAAFTRSSLARDGAGTSPIARKIFNSFNLDRSGDLFVVLEPFAVPAGSETGTTHGSPWNYDTHVPMLFWGSAFRRGEHSEPCQPADLAPTLAAALGLAQPSGATRPPLASALVKR